MGEYAEALRRAGLDREWLAPPAPPRRPHDLEEALEVEDLEIEDPPARRAPTTEALAQLGTNKPKARVPLETNAEVTPSQHVHLPRTRRGGWRARAVVVDPHGGTAESYRYFALRLGRALEERRARSVLLTSALRGEGKTTTSCNLALALATLGSKNRVALVDLDLHSPTVARSLEVIPRVGFEVVLAGQAPLDAARLQTDLVRLDIFPIGSPRESPHELLAGPGFPVALAALMERYDVVVFDTPPVLLVPDVALVAEQVHACVTVARSGTTRRAAFRDMLRLLPRERHLGTFLNSTRARGHGRYYGTYAGPAARSRGSA